MNMKQISFHFLGIILVAVHFLGIILVAVHFLGIILVTVHFLGIGLVKVHFLGIVLVTVHPLGIVLVTVHSLVSVLVTVPMAQPTQLPNTCTCGFPLDGGLLVYNQEIRWWAIMGLESIALLSGSKHFCRFRKRGGRAS